MSAITRRGFVGWAGCSALRSVFAAPQYRPYVLFIMSDDIRVELGCYGSTAITP